MPVLVTLTSSGIGRAINLDWESGKFTSYTVTQSSSGTASWTAEGSLDDLQLQASPVWFTLSSGSANSSLNIISGPLAAIRLNVAAASSAAITLRVLQGIGQ
jgi:hypothetical protein